MPYLKTLILALTIASFGVGGNSYAKTIFSNFGPANSYSTEFSWVVYGAGVFPCCGIEQAMPFEVVGNWTLTQIDVALENSGGTNSAYLTLDSDNGGFPGAIIASWNLSGLPDLLTCCTVETVTPSSAIVLSSGTTYWIAASPGANNSLDSWQWNDTGSTGISLESDSSGDFIQEDSTPSAFDVLGSPTPEPGSSMLFSLGLVALGGLRILNTRRTVSSRAASLKAFEFLQP